MHSFPISRPAIVLLVSVLSIAACDSQGENDETPPELLSDQIFSLQTDLFAPGGAKTGALKANFANAALRVWPVSLIIGANLIVPAAVTAAALEDSPEFVDGAWEWTRSAIVDEATINFALTARPDGTTIYWSMKISGEDPVGGAIYNEFELFTGETTAGEQAGSWNLYYDIAGKSTHVLSADFDLGEEDVKSITYRVPVTSDLNGGDSVTYETNGDDRHFLWQQIGEALSHDIEWNAVTKAGSITATNYKAGVKSCWDTLFDDVACGG